MFKKRYLWFTRKLSLTSSRIILLGFAVTIILGTIMLSLPVSSSTGTSVGWLNALFTSTSAVCVTGLVVLDTGTDFSNFGQIIILLLIQIGGLGFMTFSVLIAVILGKKIGLKERLLIQQSSNSIETQGVVRLSLSIVLISFIFETLGALLLTVRWANDLGVAKALYYGIFHSISAFNNAGFSLWSDSLSRYVGDPLVNIVISFLFIIGGIGFIVILDLYRKRSWKALSFHTKIVLITSGVLCFAGFLVIFVFELFNTRTFGTLTWGERIWGGYFQGVVTRTAGFNSIDIGAMLPASQFFMIFLMFIGASSGSTGGGIKTTTFAVLILSIFSTIKGNADVQLLKKRIPQDLIFRSLAVMTISLGLVLGATFLLTITEYTRHTDILALLFEATSAFGTVGMSMGLTPDLSPIGKCIIIVIMYIGRLGPLTLAFALAQKSVKQKYRYPEDKLLIG
ncbi:MULTISPECIES: TrkH family potassium uptake protein [unclassified Paenibacillus]|uniref:TrkH family potassium uptake protein n=1 Tax=unclassified Paenibacillus TaxID=185978 RepID=UPI0003E1EE40|nr:MULTISPECIES: TrkH family potassium uptake protein [unclassified Paenibacillus]ETT32960.1 TrkH family potassium uptake protein [Paenibacillus sp. FSL R7-269]OMG00820.1 Ktr system potassium transporter B [Paenibacillus sp. FSL R7-0337]